MYQIFDDYDACYVHAIKYLCCACNPRRTRSYVCVLRACEYPRAPSRRQPQSLHSHPPNIGRCSSHVPLSTCRNKVAVISSLKRNPVSSSGRHFGSDDTPSEKTKQRRKQSRSERVVAGGEGVCNEAAVNLIFFSPLPLLSSSPLLNRDNAILFSILSISDVLHRRC